jgi:hypothetical protein
VFNDNGMTATVGSYAFGFTWASVVCLFIATCLFGLGCCVGRNRDKRLSTTRSEHEAGGFMNNRWGTSNVPFFRRERKVGAGTLDSS